MEDPTPTPKRNAPWWVKVFVVIHIIGITVYALPIPPNGYRNGSIKTEISTASPSAFVQSTSRALNFGTLQWNYEYGKGNGGQTPSIFWYYTGITGFWQYWDMFAPNPADTDFWADAEVVYRDGTVKRYQYPRIYLLSIPEKYVKERYRKFLERARNEQYSYLFPAFGQRVALLNYTDSENPPVIVRMFRHWRQIAPPGKPQPEEYSSYMYYEHLVDLEKLDRAKRGEL